MGWGEGGEGVGGGGGAGVIMLLKFSPVFFPCIHIK